MLLGYRRYKALANLYIGLVHYPIINKHKEVITTAITNYDIHDIARASITYDVSKYFVIHNIPAQRELAATIMEHWKSGFGSTYNPDRKDAFTGVELVNSIAVRSEERRVGKECLRLCRSRWSPYH